MKYDLKRASAKQKNGVHLPLTEAHFIVSTICRFLRNMTWVELHVIISFYLCWTRISIRDVPLKRVKVVFHQDVSKQDCPGHTPGEQTWGLSSQRPVQSLTVYHQPITQNTTRVLWTWQVLKKRKVILKVTKPGFKQTSLSREPCQRSRFYSVAWGLWVGRLCIDRRKNKRQAFYMCKCPFSPFVYLHCLLYELQGL